MKEEGGRERWMRREEERIRNSEGERWMRREEERRE